MVSVKMAKMNGLKRWPKQEPWFRDPLVCRRCGKLMRDSEPMSPQAEDVRTGPALGVQRGWPWVPCPEPGCERACLVAGVL